MSDGYYVSDSDMLCSFPVHAQARKPIRPRIRAAPSDETLALHAMPPCDAIALAISAPRGHCQPMTHIGFHPTLRIVLGPTNTGKTHLAMQRLLAHDSGMIGLPLRLLAREIYDRCLKGDFGRVHKADLALITGEEKILPPKARYFICTTEAMPISREVEFVAIDECQLAADAERGHVFTDRLLHARGTAETILLGASTMAPILRQLLGKVDIETRARFSRLSWGGSHKLSRLPRRSAVTSFSADRVYAMAEIIRQQRGGAAVVMGGLSPRTHNAQVEMYQSGEVDFLVATDAIGMGLNMDVDHVAFAQRRKFDGRQHRDLSAAELAQIAGRAGRHTSDGSFGVTADLDAFDDALIEQIEAHEFEPVKGLFWRNPNLDFSSLDALLLSLERAAPRAGLVRAPIADDQQALKLLSRDPQSLDLLGGDEGRLRLLWEVAQIPDFRKTTMGEHAALIGELFAFLVSDEGAIPEAWLAERIERCDRLDGDLDTLSMRLAHIRSWTYIAQRNDWLADPTHWQERARHVEDRLSDALHMKLMGQFVDRKTSALMRRLAGREDIVAELEDNGDILIAGEYMGRLNGLHVERDPRLKGTPAGTARAAVEKTVGEALRQRAQELSNDADDAFTLTESGQIVWRNANVGVVQFSEKDDELAYLSPAAALLADEVLNGEVRARAEARLTAWLRDKIKHDLAPLIELQNSATLQGLGRGLAFQLLENKGSVARRDIADILSKLDQEMRGPLRKLGVRFGFYTIFMPALLKPAPARLLALLSLLQHNRQTDKPRPVEAALGQLPGAGLTSSAKQALPVWLYRAAGFYTTQSRVIRFDMLERLADIIRPLLSENKDGFEANEAMMSIMGCSADELAEILTALGYQAVEQQPQEADKEAVAENPSDTAETPAETQAEPEAETQESGLASAAPENPAPRIVWQQMRPARGANKARANAGQKSRRKADKNGTRDGARDANGTGKMKAAQKRAPQNKAKAAKRAKTADPNSPFAVLKQLQGDKQDKNSER